MITIGDYDTFKKFANIKPLIKSVKLRTLVGTHIVSEETIIDVPPEFNAFGDTMSVKLIPFIGRPFQLILGANILNPLKAKIDFSSNSVTINNQIIPFYNTSDENYEQNVICKETEICQIEKDDVNFKSVLSEDMNNEESQAISKFLKRKKNIFYQEGQQLTATTFVKHKILTEPHNPIYIKNYKNPFALEQEIDKQIDEMLKNNIIRESKSPYNSPLLIVKKKLDNSQIPKWRIVIDYRKLNSITVDDKFPIPNIESLYEKLGRSNYFSTIDLAKGFHQILMDENDIEKTAFSTTRGHYEYIRMPFGLKNAPATFQRAMNYILNEFINKICVIYMDDVLVFSTSLSEHLENLEKVFNRLMEFNLKIQFNKCKFLAKQTTFLGHDITANGIRPNKAKISAIQEVPIPKTEKQIKSFLGLSGFYRKFIKNYSTIAAPIIKYLKKNAKIDINDVEYIRSFNKLKQILTSYPLLAYPDLNKKFVVTTDASNVAIGAVLSQAEKPVCYASRTLNKHEQNYHTLERELLAIVWALKYFRPYLYGKSFTIQTDHQPLKWLFSLKEPSPRILRWQTLLSEFDFNIEYIKGKTNQVADFLSRNPTENVNNEDIEYDIKSLFENSIDSDEKFVISDFIVNKYRSQIRIMKNKVKTFETLYNKYKIIYLEEKDLSNETYLVDLFRKFLCKGTVGIYSEISEEKFNIFKNKLMSIYAEVESLKFTVCKILAKDIPSEKDLYELIEDVHLKGNHRGISENFEEIKYNYFYPNLKKYINKFINACRVCAESKYDRKPIRKKFYITETPNAPNEIVHIDIFKVCNLSYLTTIDRFTKIASMHKITDRNMCTIKLKLLERFSYLGVPSKLIMDNEFNNALIRLFCNEKNIQAHFTTPGSHTGNADIERFHSNILEHLRILKVSHCNLDTEELVMQALGFYNNTIHHATKVKPFDFLDITKKLDLQQLKDNLKNSKVKSINRINARRESIPNIENRSIYIKNSQAARNKIAKRYNKFNKNNPNKIDIACVKRPLKIFP